VEKIPESRTVEEILELCKGKIGIYLDLKDAHIPELMKLIKKITWKGCCMVYSITIS